MSFGKDALGTTVARKATKRRKANPTQFCDVLGVILLFLGPISFLFLVADNAGECGRAMQRLLTGLMGVGAYVAPLLFIALSLLLLVGPMKLAPRSSGIGVVVLFICILAWRQMDIWAANSKALGGGLLGVLAANGLDRMFGVASSWFLALIIAVTVIFTFNVPLGQVIEFVLETVRGGAEVAKGRMTPAESKKNTRAVNTKVTEEKVQKPLLAKILDKVEDTFHGHDEDDEEPQEEPKPERKVVVNLGPPAPAPRKDQPDPTMELDLDGSDDVEGEFKLPPLSLLAPPQPPPARVEAELKGNIEIIERTLEEFKVPATVVEIAHGPTVTRYEIQLAPGVKVSKIVSLADNLAMQLAAIDVRVEAPIPGKAAIGVEVPNKLKGTVGLREVIEHEPFMKNESLLVFALGKDVSGEPKFADLAKMPHLLVAGSTNSGKSVALNALITSFLFRCTPEQLKLILIDPKRVELSLFDGIPHLACPVVKDVRLAAGVFRQAVKEMDHRYELISRVGARNILGYNEKVPEDQRMPYIVLVVDELADLMMQAGAEVEQHIARLAQLARATGIHLVIATQRPSVDVVTGLIKANISSRISFAVSSQVDSRTILDQNGAERLIGRGDMLFLPIDASKPARIQGCFVSEKETEAVVTYLKSQRKPVYSFEPADIAVGGGAADDEGLNDELYESAVRLIVAKGSASTSMLQRRFKIGYTRAARLVDTMEQQGIVGPLDGAKPREVLVSQDELDRIFGGRNLGYGEPEREVEAAEDESEEF